MPRRSITLVSARCCRTTAPQTDEPDERPTPISSTVVTDVFHPIGAFLYVCTDGKNSHTRGSAFSEAYGSRSSAPRPESEACGREHAKLYGKGRCWSPGNQG
jgi:hypothetical protein